MQAQNPPAHPADKTRQGGASTLRGRRSFWIIQVNVRIVERNITLKHTTIDEPPPRLDIRGSL